MSSIAGFLRFSDTAPAEWLHAMLGTMASPQPDVVQTWTQGPVAFGARWPTPHSAPDRPPALVADGQLVLALDGHVDDVSAQLGLDTPAQGDGTDRSAALVLAAYRRWGPSCAGELTGDFAFAVWDGQCGQVVVATDRMGARPLLYAHTGSLFAFASSEEALLGLPGVSAVPDEERVAGLFIPGFGIDGDRSWLRDISKLGPARQLQISRDGRLQGKRYWAFGPGAQACYRDTHECVDAFKAVFDQAVRARLPRERNVALMLSGGIDSSAILASIVRSGQDWRERLDAYSVVRDNAGCVESAAIRDLTSRHLATAHRAVLRNSPSNEALARDVREVAWAKAHPVDNGALLPALICLMAGRNGHRTLLHGACGDVTLDAPDRYIAHVMRGVGWGAAWAESVAASRHNTYLAGMAPVRLFLLNAWSAYAPSLAKQVAHRLRRPVHPLPPLLGRELAKRLQVRERLHANAVQEGRARGFSDDFQASALQLFNGTRGQSVGLAGFARIGARFGLDARDPWGDYRVAEFFLRLPLQFKVREGWGKYLVRLALEDAAGDSVRWRVGKEHVGWALIELLMDVCHAEIVENLSAGRDELSRFLEPDALEALLLRYCADRERKRHQWSADRTTVYQAMTLLAWLRRLRGAEPFTALRAG